MNTLIRGREVQGPWRPLTWKQGIFSDTIPHKFDELKCIWMEIRSVVIWALWIERNDKVFNASVWTPEKMEHTI